VITGTSLADENVIGIGVTDSVNWNGEVVTAMAVSEGVSMVVEKYETLLNDPETNSELNDGDLQTLVFVT